MTPRSLFTVVVKVIALFLIIDSLNFLTPFFKLTYHTLELNNFNFDVFFIFTGLLLLLILYLFYKLIMFLLFKTNNIIDKLKLDEHFKEDTFNLNLEPKILFRYAIIIIGVVIFYNSIFDFITEISNYFSVLKNQTSYTQKPLKIYFIIEFVKIIIGYLFIFNSQFISNYILKKQVEINEENITEDVK